MFVYTPESAQRGFSPWGNEVKRRIKERGMLQAEFAALVREATGKQTFDANRLNETLRGVGTRPRYNGACSREEPRAAAARH